MKISAALIIHNDASLLQKCISSIEHHIDELIVVDGAYSWVAPFSKLFGESSEESTDELKSVLSRCDIPVKYFKGVWRNETHKRRFSLEQASNDIVMNVDSDELFEIDWSAVKSFCNSGYAIGNCSFPLYFNPNHVGMATGLKSPPNKAIFINKGVKTIEEIVNSMFLLVPKEERKNRLQNSDIYADSLGTVHHLSNFRTGDGAYRRARFYNLLSFRINGKVNIVAECEIQSDAHFVQIIESLPEVEKEAMNNYFYYHRLSWGFPVIKDNQKIVKIQKNLPEIDHEIQSVYRTMIMDHDDRLNAHSDSELLVFSNRGVFLEVTRQAKKQSAGLRFTSENFKSFDVICTAEFNDGSRSELACERLESSDGQALYSNWSGEGFDVASDSVERVFLEVIPRGSDRLGRFVYSVVGTE